MPTSEQILETHSEEVDHIIDKIRHKRDRYHLLQWLNNFHDDDKISALDILNRMVYLDDDQLHLEANNLIKMLEDKTPTKCIFYLYPIAKYGKSATLLSYFIKHSERFVALNKEKRIYFLDNKESVNTTVIYDNDVLVLFDDFLGSGGSYKETYEDLVKLSSPKFTSNKHQFAISIYRMEIAESNIKATYPLINFLGKVHFKLFGTDPLMFDSSTEVARQKELATHYAKVNGLFIVKGTPHHLGFQNSEALISFAYKPPNNTLPIIWAKNQRWIPFLPRYESEIYRSVTEYREINMIAAAKLEFGIERGKIVDYDLFRLPLVLSMLKRKTSVPLIAVIIGISLDDLEEILKIGITEKFLVEPAKITDAGYAEIKKIEGIVKSVKALEVTKRDVKNYNIEYMSKKVARK